MGVLFHAPPDPVAADPVESWCDAAAAPGLRTGPAQPRAKSPISIAPATAGRSGPMPDCALFARLWSRPEARGSAPRTCTLRQLDHLEREARRSGGSRARADLDLSATDAYFTLGREWTGLAPDLAAVHDKWEREPLAEDSIIRLIEALADPIAAVDTLRAMRPADARYDRLVTAYDHYRRLAAAGGWPGLPPGSDGEAAPVLHPGDEHPDVAALRRRLACEDPTMAPESSNPRCFDAALVAARSVTSRSAAVWNRTALSAQRRERP